VSRTLAAHDTSIDAVLRFHVREDELLTRPERRARADETEEVITHRFNVYVSATKQRATKPRTCAEARSSHCSSPTKHTSGCSAATSGP
jgi:adenylate kinase family enzyme